MPYCIYLRKSRADLDAEARGEGESLARHEATLLSLAKKQGLTITQIYQEIVSGETISARPEVQKMLHEVESGLWEGVLVMEVERLARGNTIDQGIVAQAFQTTGTKIITPIKVYDPNNEFDQEYFEFGLFMSRREFITINRRMQRGRIASVNEGNFLGSKPPFGYDLYRTPDKRHTLKINDEQAPIVQMIFDLFTGDYMSDMLPMGCSLIVKYLNDKGIPSATGGKWTPSVVRSILTNPVYIGKIRWNNRQTVKKVTDGVVSKHRPRAGSQALIVQGIHSPIISDEQFNKVSELFESNKQPTGPKPTKEPNPLLKLVRCSCCGKNLIKRPDRKNSRTQLLCITPDCPTVGSPLDLVEEMVLKALEEWMENFKLSQTESSAPADLKKLDTIISNTIKKIDSLNAQENKTYELLEQGIYSTEVFLKRQKAIADSRASLEQELDQLKRNKLSIEQIYKNQTEIIPNIEYVLNNYNDASAEEKNKMLRRVLDHISYSKTTRMNPRTKDGGDLSVTIIPKF